MAPAPPPLAAPRAVTAKLAQTVGRSGAGGAGLAGRRFSWLLLASIAASVLATAHWLTPAMEGHGTHTQLGLPPCGFLFLTSLPCPGCGLTTGFAHLARGQLVAAWVANPLALPLFALTVVALPLSLLGAWQGWSPSQTFQGLGGERLLLLLSGLAMLGWGARVATILLS